MDSVVFERTTLPILHACDAVVVGGSFAGVAAALALARAGRAVALVEPRTYLGHEVTATLRPWIRVPPETTPPPLPPQGATPSPLPLQGATPSPLPPREGQGEGRSPTVNPSTLPELVAACIEASGTSAVAGEFPLHLDAVKTRLEDLVLGADVRLIYASLPVGLCTAESALRGVVVGNKSGRQVLTCRLLVDATPTALVARLAGAAFRPAPNESANYTISLEFDGVAFQECDNLVENVAVLRLPSHLGVIGDKAVTHRGYRPGSHAYLHGHTLIECTFELPARTATALDITRRYVAAREKALDVASYLLWEDHHFRLAYLAAMSHELYGPHTTPLAGPLPAWARSLDSAHAEIGDGLGQWYPVPLSSFASPLVGIWCLNEAVRLEPAVGSLMRDPLPASLLGTCLARALDTHWETTAVPAQAMPGAGAAIPAPAPATPTSSRLQVKELDSPQRGRRYERIPVAAPEVPIIDDVDVLVVGGGTSGAIAAIAAAREGVRTFVVEMNPSLGGTATYGGVKEYWAGWQGGFTAQSREWVNRVHDRLRYPRIHGLVGGWNIEAKAQALVQETRNAHTEMLFDALVFGAVVEGNGRLESLPHSNMVRDGRLESLPHSNMVRDGRLESLPHSNMVGDGRLESLPHSNMVGDGRLESLPHDNTVRGVVAATRMGPVAVLGKVVIDATGDGDVAAFAGAEFTYGSARDHAVMWYSLAQFGAPGQTHNNFTSMVDVSNVVDYSRAILSGRRRGGRLHDHGAYIATRESRHVRGDVVQTLTDQLVQRCWPDAINVAVSNNDVKGQISSDWMRIGLIPPNLEIESPYRILLPQGLENILVVGKAVSVARDALPSIRMQPDLENQGGAAGLAAALAVRGGKSLREIDVRVLQERPVRIGTLPERVLTRHLVPRRYSDAELEALIDELVADERPLHAYSKMELNEVFRGRIPLVEVCCAGPRVIPMLEKALERMEGSGKVRLAQALALLRSPAGVPVLVSAIQQQLAGSRLPERKDAIKHTDKYAPDQAAMPDVAYLIYALGLARDRRALPVWQRVVDLLAAATEEDVWSQAKGVFGYVDAVCCGAEQLGDPAAVPILKQLHGYAPFHHKELLSGFQADYLKERPAYLEVVIGRALARCGSPHGVVILINYLNDVRALLAEQAHDELIAMSGLDYGKDAAAWSQWLEAAGEALRPVPWSAPAEPVVAWEDTILTAVPDDEDGQQPS